MKKVLITSILIMTIILTVGCNQRKKVKSGRIDIEMYIYPDASLGGEEAIHFPISRLYFSGDNFIEVLPKYTDSISQLPFVFIQNGEKYTRFKDFNTISDIDVAKFKDVAKKTIGVKFKNDSITDFSKREALTDTVFNGFNYKRYKIVSPDAYTVFYVHQTDSLLPFSLSNQFDKEARGILNRVDTYEMKEDRFTSLRLTLNDTIPADIFKALKSR